VVGVAYIIMCNLFTLNPTEPLYIGSGYVHTPFGTTTQRG